MAGGVCAEGERNPQSGFWERGRSKDGQIKDA